MKMSLKYEKSWGTKLELGADIPTDTLASVCQPDLPTVYLINIWNSQYGLNDLSVSDCIL